MAVNGTIAKTNFTDADNLANGVATTVKAVHITELRTAISALEGYAKNVDNCGYTNCCESCQDTCACQSCQTSKCQSCQNTCSCQSCQSNICQSCQRQCGGTCLLAGTLILMSDKTWKPIETITAGESVYGIGGINKVIGIQKTHLGNRRALWTFNDRSIFFSGEHLFWVKKKDNEFFGVADMTQHIREKDVELFPQFKGLTINRDVICIDRPVQFATIDGWKLDEPIIAREYGSCTPLYELVLAGSHTMIANGYVTGGNAHDDDFDYDSVHWNGLKG